MKTGWTQHANGAFDIGIRSGFPHCGVDDRSTIQIQYRIRLEFRSDALSAEGFLIDNTWFREYFATLRDTRLSISCEKFAELIATQICESCNCYSLQVELSAIPDVWVGVQYLNPRFAHLWDECPVKKVGAYA